MRNFKIALALFLGFASLNSCKQEAKEEHKTEIDSTKLSFRDKPINTQNMNLSVKPGDDFFEYGGGGWLKRNPIPDDKTAYGSFDILFEENNEALKKMIDEATTNRNAPKGTPAQQMGDFFAAGMDTLAA